MTPKEPSWIGLSLALDAEGCIEPFFKWVSTANEALAVLRDECFDCLVFDAHLSARRSSSEMASREMTSRDLGPHGVQSGRPAAVHESNWEPRAVSASRSQIAPLDAVANETLLALVLAVRGAGCDDPILMLAEEPDDAQWKAAHAACADVLVTRRGWDSPALVPAVARAMERAHLLRENQRFTAADRRRLVRERDEAENLLLQQRQILEALEKQSAIDSIADAASGMAHQETRAPAGSLPADVETYYQELLRTYVIMGSGNLGTEIGKLVAFLACAELSPRQALELHLQRVEQLVRGLGNRSTRHVMARADLLALELMIHLGEHYQRRGWGMSRDGGAAGQLS